MSVSLLRRLTFLPFCFGLALIAPPAHGQDEPGGKTSVRIEDEQGNEIFFEVGKAAFADNVASFSPGDPMSAQDSTDGDLALGLPDYTRGNGISTAITLGCSGVIRLQFADNVLVDGPGPDLHVFEVGPDVEPTFLAISTDGNAWRDIGSIEGGTASLDISAVADSGDVFRFVRLTEDGEDCTGDYPGADIDAVGAIHASEVVELSGNLLFGVDSSTLRTEAQTALRRIANQLTERDVQTVTIVGHTDAQGNEAYNQTLSEERAASVRRYLVDELGITDITFTVRGAAAREPVASNDTAAGRRQNRRVEFIF